MLKRVSFLFTVFLLIVSAFPALAIDEIPAASPTPAQVFVDQVYIRSHRVEVEINNQVATTRVEQIFVNEGEQMAEGTYIFPLPSGATVSDLVMWVDGEPITAQILDANQASDIYQEIVRQMRDPALLEYIGRDAIQASVFPIMPHDEVKIEIEYSHIIPLENGLLHYVYPIKTDQFTRQPVGTLSVSVEVNSDEEISTVYSPSHNLAVDRDDNFHFRAGYETSNTREANDFSLYYGLASEVIDLNLLTYRESANEDGFFLLLLAPPVNADEVEIQPKDVIIVLDQSGSMFGEKWSQAQNAVKFVLEHLNPEDRFNVVAFSTGYRIYANDLQSPSSAQQAVDWVMGLEAVGGTDIDGALTEAFDMAEDSERQTIVLFMTDGEPTEGETDIQQILENAQNNAPENARLFSFGVGDDVNTFLLDQLFEMLHGTGVYVRPSEDIEAEVSNLYGKISAPVMTNIDLEISGNVVLEDMYPAAPLPDLFLGSQLIVAGRYRGDGEATITLTGKVNDEIVTFTFDEIEFQENAGGEPTIPRLWATRKIGSMLNSIRLHGEDPELVDSIVRLSLRYGIITPYTSFLIQESDIFTQAGREEAAGQVGQSVGEFDDDFTGSEAVDAADTAIQMEQAEAAPVAAPTSGAVGFGGGGGDTEAPMDLERADNEVGFYDARQPLQIVGDRTFVLRDQTWIDTLYNPDEMEVTEIVFLSDEYFALLDEHPEIGEYLTLGDHIILVIEDEAYEIIPE